MHAAIERVDVPMFTVPTEGQLEADDEPSWQMLLWLAEEAATTCQSPDAGM